MTENSTYFYPETNVFINKPSIRDQKQLKSFERTVTALRLAELHSSPVSGNFDLDHLQHIHKYLFQDIYYWAGEIREVDISKGNTMFARTIYITNIAKDLFNTLKTEDYLQNLRVDDFSKRAGYYMAEINMLHPFREGNGRTQREFIRCLALNAGYELHWSRLDKGLILEASVKSVHNSQELVKIIRSSIINKISDPSLISSYNSSN